MPGHRHLEQRRVEIERGELQYPVAGLDRKHPPERGQRIGEAGMGDEHAFWPAGRAGGVDDAGEIGRWIEREAAVGHAVGPRQVLVQGEDVALAGGQAPAQPLLGQHEPHPAVVEHVGEPLGRIGRIERQIGAARLPHGEQPDDRVERALDAQPDQLTGVQPTPPQRVGNAIGAAVELTVGQGFAEELDRDVVRRAAGLRLEHRIHRAEAGLGGIDIGARELVPPGVVQDQQRSDRLRRIGPDPVEQRDVVLRDAGDGGLIEQPRVVLEEQAQPVGGLGRAQGQIEFRGAGAKLRRVVLRAGGEIALGILQREHDLKERIVAEAALRPDLLDQPLERQLLMRVGLECSRALEADELGERLAAVLDGVRSTSVLSMKPMTCSTSLRPRFAIGAPIHRSFWPVMREAPHGTRASRITNCVAPVEAPSARIGAIRSPPSSIACRAPRAVAIAGRGRLSGSSVRSGASASLVFQ